MSPQTTLNIGYCNVRGLNDTCFDELISYIHTCKFHIIVASETWFLNRNKYKSHSFYYQESTYYANNYTNRRHDGGLLLLVSPTISNQISITSTTKYSININLKNTNKNLSFVYFPPSLSNSTIQNELKNIGPIDCLIGDYNFRLGSISGDKVSTATQRKNIVYDFISQYHLKYLRNDNHETISRTDHIFTNINTLKWTYKKPNFLSDHQLMSISFETPFFDQSSPHLGTKRYNLKPLHNEIFKHEFVHIYETQYATNILIECEATLDFCCHTMILPSTTDTQEIIDITYNHLTDTINTLLEQTLPSYDAQAIKSTPDSLLKTLSQPNSNQQTIRGFKRWQRTLNANSPIISVNPNLSPLDECKTHYQSQFNSTEEIPTIERQNNTTFGLLFTEDKIKKRILRYSNTKSIGPDNIHTIVWKTLTTSIPFMRSLSALFQLFASTALVPSAWSTANLHLLKKDPANPTASNTRPISLCDILRRIFEQLVLRFWMIENETWTQLNYSQAGFRKGYSTLSHLILSDELSRRNSKYSIFLDIKSAFDSLSWKKLNETLILKNCPAHHRNLILSLICKPASLFLSVNHSERVTITTRKGVFQGGGISAFVFTLYLDPLATSINSNSVPHQPLALFFADDIQIKASNMQEAQTALDYCTQYGHDYNLKWNLSKCAVVSNISASFLLDNQTIPSSSEYKYLGVLHTATGLNLRKSFLTKSKLQSDLLTSLQDNNWHPKAKFIIFRTFIRPITEYTSILTYLWALKHPSRTDILTLMKQQHQQALQWIFSRHKHTNTLDFLSGLGPWDHRMESLRAGLTRSLQDMSPSNPLLAARLVFLISSSSHFILQTCFKSPYWSDYQKVKYLNLMKVLPFKTWLVRKVKSLAMTASKSSALIAYLSPHTYLNACHPFKIRLLFNLPRESFFDILAWRLNNCFSCCTCLCGSLFRRSHLDCILDTNELYQTTLHSAPYLNSLTKVSSSSAVNYSVLDFLLNQSKFDHFTILFSVLRSHLI